MLSLKAGKTARGQRTSELSLERGNFYEFCVNDAIDYHDPYGLSIDDLKTDYKTLKELYDAVKQAAKDAKSGKCPKDPCKVPSSLNAVCTCLYSAAKEAKEGEVDKFISDSVTCICQFDPDPDCERNVTASLKKAMGGGK